MPTKIFCSINFTSTPIYCLWRVSTLTGNGPGRERKPETDMIYPGRCQTAVLQYVSPYLYMTVITRRSHAKNKKNKKITSALSSLCGISSAGWNKHVETVSWLNPSDHLWNWGKWSHPDKKRIVRCLVPVLVLARVHSSLFKGCPSSVELVFCEGYFTIWGPRDGRYNNLGENLTQEYKAWTRQREGKGCSLHGLSCLLQCTPRHVHS